MQILPRKNDRRIGARLSRAFLIQAAFISIAGVLGVFVAGALLEGALVRTALTNEATHFWEQRDARPDFQLPHTRNLRGYLDEGLPQALRPLQPGFHSWAHDGVQSMVYVTERGGERLTLVFDRTNVGRLAAYYGLAPLASVLLIVYLSSWLGYRASRHAISPIVALARQVRQLDPEAPGAGRAADLRAPDEADDEVRELTDALQRYAQRLERFLEREREFTRDASHELRSPLTVIRMAAGLLSDPDSSEATRRTAQRIQRAAQDMEELTSAFLLLARETETGLPADTVCLNTLLSGELERASLIASDRAIAASLRAANQLYVDAPEKVLSVLLGNLLRNAFTYTDAGEVVVEIVGNTVVIRDTGRGMQAESIEQMFRPFVRGAHDGRSGHGVGLTIVRRLSDRFAWPIDVTSEPGVGTQVAISFPQARTEPLG